MEAVTPPEPVSVAEKWAGLQTKWDKRTQLAAAWLQDDTIVADIGCGLMALEACLPSGTTYVPIDVVARDRRTIVVDLNRDPLPAVQCSAAVMLGVLEYIDDTARVLQQLRIFPKILISYNHVSINDLLWKFRLRPKRVDWRSRHTRLQFRRLLAAAGLHIVRQRNVRFAEIMYEVHPVPAAVMKTPEHC